MDADSHESSFLKHGCLDVRHALGRPEICDFALHSELRALRDRVGCVINEVPRKSQSSSAQEMYT